jgi:Peptidase A4 family
MARRWRIPLMTLPVVAGLMLVAGAALASPGSPHRAAQHPAAQAVSPGHPNIAPGGVALPSIGGGLNSLKLSANWSGYALFRRGNGAFHGVSASWIQPRATCRSARVNAYAAFWVGLDGYNPNPQVIPTSVEQTGTDSDCRGRTPTYYGWYEMYPAAPVFFRTKVNPGDHISASVTFRSTRTYVLVLRDSTRGWTHTIVKNKPGLARSSAEVITEAPSSPPVVLPLADFGTIRYTGSKANGVLLRKLAPTRIIMVHPLPDGSLHYMDSTSLIGSADVFGNTWLRSN